MRRLAKPASDEHAAHPGRQYVVGLVEAWADAQWHYLATEFVAGGDLFDALERHGAFARDEARRLFAQVALAVDFVHCCGLHHLDLSLENVLLTPEGVARLSDFGAALPAPKDGAPHRLRDDERPGKVLYMSPEVAAGRDFDGRAQDAFALGVLLYELLTSSQPFLQADLADVRFRLIQEGKLARVLERQGLDLQPDAVELLEGLLAADPARRLSVEDALAHRWLVGPQPQPQPEQAKSA
jgi:serine/threonine protein kinase